MKEDAHAENGVGVLIKVITLIETIDCIKVITLIQF